MRSCGGVLRQPGKAAAAAFTAASTSSACARGTRARTSALAGLKTSTNSEELLFLHSPAMKLGNTFEVCSRTVIVTLSHYQSRIYTPTRRIEATSARMLHITKQELRLYFRGSYQSTADEVKPLLSFMSKGREDASGSGFNAPDS